MLSTRTKLAVVALLYFSEGFPFGLINNALSVYFRVKKISLEEIGLLSLLGLAWSLKLLWAPLVDRFGRRYFWIIPAQLSVAFCSAALTVFDPVSEKAMFWLALAGICLASATQDIAADAYTIDILDEKELGPANGVRSASYRVALIAAGGLLVMLSDSFGWSFIFIAAAMIMAILAVLVLSFPAFRRARPAVSTRPALYQQWVGPIRVLFQRPNFLIAIAFILSFKVGEAMLVAMANPFWIDRGFTPAQVGFVVGTLGTLASIVGAIAGGSLTARWGIVRSLWILGAIQAGASLGYTLASLPFAPAFSIYFAAPLESLAIGLATSAFLSFLMKLCDKRFSATHYAFLSTLFALGRSLAGVLSGYSAAYLGYPVFFLATFLIGLAPLLLIPFLKPTLIWAPKEEK
ncbi:MAG: AmpG family muropeptide MFS transporter [Deltaproteobacteria bacterium]|nr:AmpG family muropeptide MFS transporter [Deltaproteobacteria bacterium]